MGRLFSDWSATEDKLGDSLQKAGHYLDRQNLTSYVKQKENL